MSATPVKKAEKPSKKESKILLHSVFDVFFTYPRHFLKNLQDSLLL